MVAFWTCLIQFRYHHNNIMYYSGVTLCVVLDSMRRVLQNHFAVHVMVFCSSMCLVWRLSHRVGRGHSPQGMVARCSKLRSKVELVMYFFILILNLDFSMNIKSEPPKSPTAMWMATNPTHVWLWFVWRWLGNVKFHLFWLWMFCQCAVIFQNVFFSFFHYFFLAIRSFEWWAQHVS